MRYQSREKLGVENKTEGRECKPFTFVPPDLSAMVERSLYKLHEVQFHKSQNEMFCTEQKKSLSKVAFLYKAIESHEY